MAIDSLYRYDSTEMFDRVRRRLNAVQAAVDPTTGEESAAAIQDQLVSNTDILNKINSVLVGVYTDIMVSNPDAFEQDIYIDVQAYNNQYAFPLGMIQFIGLGWKDPSVTINLSYGPNRSPKPIDYIEMICVDNMQDYDEQVGRYSAPTWRRQGDQFSLNEFPRQDNILGILVRGVFLPPPLSDMSASPAPSNPVKVIQAPFARIAQEVVIIESAKQLGMEKLGADMSFLDEERKMWGARLYASVDNYQHPASIQMTTSRFIQATYSGRNR